MEINLLWGQYYSDRVILVRLQPGGNLSQTRAGLESSDVVGVRQVWLCLLHLWQGQSGQTQGVSWKQVSYKYLTEGFIWFTSAEVWTSTDFLTPPPPFRTQLSFSSVVRLWRGPKKDTKSTRKWGLISSLDWVNPLMDQSDAPWQSVFTVDMVVAARALAELRLVSVFALIPPTTHHHPPP